MALFSNARFNDGANDTETHPSNQNDMEALKILSDLEFVSQHWEFLQSSTSNPETHHCSPTMAQSRYPDIPLISIWKHPSTLSQSWPLDYYRLQCRDDKKHHSAVWNRDGTRCGFRIWNVEWRYRSDLGVHRSRMFQRVRLGCWCHCNRHGYFLVPKGIDFAIVWIQV